MVLDTVVDLSVLSYPMLIIMKKQGVDVVRGGAYPRDVGQGRASPRMSGGAEPSLKCWARQSQPLDVGQGGAYPQTLGKANPALRHRARQRALSHRAGQSLPLDIGRGRAYPQMSTEAEPTLGHWARQSLPLDIG
jgi:hypothetical protein